MKYLKQNEKKPINWLLIGLCVLTVVALILAVLYLDGREDPQTPTEDPGAAAQTQPTETEPPTTAETQPQFPALTLPYTMEDGKLSIDAFFQFTGLNPDKNDEEAEDVAALQLTNLSQEHLAFATISVTTTEGVTASFVVYDIPAGRSAMIFCPDNIVIETNPECAQITCDAVFEPESPLAADKLAISVEGTDITLENISGEDLSRITVYCHSILDQSCYGGMVYSYNIDSLPAGETADISAWECYLGLVEVVRIEIGSE